MKGVGSHGCSAGFGAVSSGVLLQ